MGDFISKLKNLAGYGAIFKNIQETHQVFQEFHDEAVALDKEKTDLLEEIEIQANKYLSLQATLKQQGGEQRDPLSVPIDITLIERICNSKSSWGERRTEMEQKGGWLKQQLQSVIIDANGACDTQAPPKDKRQKPDSYSKVSGVQLYIARKDSFGQRMLQDLDQYLKDCLKHLKTTIISDLTEAQPNQPLVVICVHAARLEADIDLAILNVEKYVGPEKIACVVVHYKEEHALPLTQTREILTSAKVKGFGAVIDAAYFDDFRFYQCAMNNNALRELIAFIERQ